MITRLVSVAVLCLIGSGAGADEIVVASSDQFELYSRPLPSPYEGFAATIVGMRTIDPSHSVGSVSSVHVHGAAHQTWFRDDTGVAVVRTPFRQNTYEFDPAGVPVPLPLPQYARLDSHLLPFCGIEADCDPFYVGESNDASNPKGFRYEAFGSLDGWIDNYYEVFGFGDIVITDESVGVDFFEAYRTPSRDLLYLVTQADLDSGEPTATIDLTLRAVGVDADGRPLNRAFIVNSAIVPFSLPVPEPSGLILLVTGIAGVYLKRAARK
ncbi:MAG: PEP-CTERM sorting domain-containing protein [Planctomycetales bacterium]|nr:PEP-CTERM sorting domain-containing protein [Planctomycetales bacterium]